MCSLEEQNMKHNFRRLAAIVLTAATVFSFSAVAASVASGADETDPAPAAGAGKTPIAAFDFKKDLKEHSGRTDVKDVVIDSSTSQNAVYTEGSGIKLTDGSFTLPENIFTGVDLADIDGFTFSVTITGKTEWGAWNEVLFSMSDVDTQMGAPAADRRDASFYINYNGCIGTAKYPYRGNDGNGWIDLAGAFRPTGDKFTVTVTYDVASNVLVLYRDGLTVASSEGTQVDARLTAEQIHSFAAAAIGRACGGNDGVTGVGNYTDVTVYSTALSAAEVKVLATEGWEAVKEAGETKEPVTEKAWPTLNGEGDGTFTAAALNVDGLPVKLTVDFLGLGFDFDLNEGGPGESGTTKLSSVLAAKGWDILAVSENFSYHEQLESSLLDKYGVIYENEEEVPVRVELESRFKAEGSKAIYIPFKTDGLSLFYKNTLTASQKSATPWNEHYSPDETVTGSFALPMKNGADGLITKGFRHFEVGIADGLTVDVYTLHMDAEDSAEDRAARDSQLKQLADYIVGTKTKNPIIIMGDTNCRYTRDDVIGSLIGVLNAEDNLYARDAWVDTVKDGQYPVNGSPALNDEIVDKIIFVNNSESDYQIFLNSYKSEWLDVSPENGPDHPAVVAEFTYQKTENTTEPTPDTTPDTTPATTPDTSPATTPDTTPATTPDTTPSTTPSTTPGTSADTTPGGESKPPKTGDSDNIGIWVALSVICLAGLGAVVFTKHTEKE